MLLRLLLILTLLGLTPPLRAQEPSAPCGLVDALDYPIDKLVEGYDDFARYRARFGGNHTGIDIGFDRWGEPVQAAARGRVTYADPEGWDTEKGVVIVEHIFPDNTIAYSLYGHMEQGDGIFFPQVGDCVERGEVLGAIGWPSRGRPHLHYELRRFLPDDGGPGYVTGNPLDEGWYHPLDFTALWRARLLPAYVGSVTFDIVPSLPPAQMDTGGYIVASGDVLSGVTAAGETLWRLETDGVMTGLAALPGDRAIAHTRSGQALALQGGRYAAIWTVKGPDAPFLLLGERLVFVTDGGGLAAYDAAGSPLWTLPGSPGGQVARFAENAGQITLALQTANGVTWRQINAEGQVVAETILNAAAAAAPLPDGSWMLLEGATLKRLTAGANHDLATLTPPPGRAARLAADALGNTYAYLGDSDSTLLAVGADGTLRWRVQYPYPAAILPPLLAAGNGCRLYTLDLDGMLNVFNAADGALVDQVQLYAGGAENTSPRARLLRVSPDEQVQVASGFLTLLTLDGAKLGGTQVTCP